MCGLVAIFAYRNNAPPVAEKELIAVSAAMRARGPDGHGLWLADDGRVGMAHRRLAVIDLSDAAAQPMATGDGRYRIVYNGEIYNFRALRKELEAKGCVFTTQSDTEVLLHLYRSEGAAMVSRLRGMYAFAIWDEERRGMFCARDPFGIKPLYYADDGDTLRVASQVKALRAGGAAGEGADAAGHAGFFLFGYVPDPHTLYEDIRALEAGCTLWVDADGAHEIKRFFNVTSLLADTNEVCGKPVDLRELLTDSVRSHLIADVPVGVFLSAGLDSATLTGLASEAANSRLKTMTLGFGEFKDTGFDETLLAEAVAATYGTTHTTRWVSGACFHHDLQALMKAMDQPTIDGVNTYFVAKEAAGLGLKVALSGLGGDELFGGYDAFRQIPFLVDTLGSVPGMRSFGKAVRVVTAPIAKRLTSPKYAGLLEYGARYGDAYLLRRGLFMPWELPDVLGADMAEAGWRELEPLTRLEDCHRPISEPRRKVAALEMSWYMRNQLLRDADWAGMAHSLEIRTPLVDVELFNRLVPVLCRCNGPGKQEMARTPKEPLPEAVLNRSKTGFLVPIHDWLQGESNDSPERGLRGWARQVYAAQT